MLIRELLLEVQPWTNFTGVSSSRVWFNARTGEAITTPEEGNHSVGVINNAELFGLTPEDLAAAGIQPGKQFSDPMKQQPGQTPMDYNGAVLYAAMEKGWVRIRVDPRAPDVASNAEGINTQFLRRAMLWYVDKVGMPMRFVLVLRHGTGDQDGTSYPLNSKQEIEQFVQSGRIRRDLVNQNPSTQIRQTQNTGKHPLWGNR